MSDSGSTRPGGGPPVVVLGTGITALGVQRIFSRARVASYQSDGTSPLLRRSRAYRPLPGGARIRSEASLADDLSNVGLDTAVLMPCSDAWVSAVADLAPDLKARFPSSSPGTGVASALVDKARFAEALVEHEVSHPWSFEVTSVGDLRAVLDRADADLFLKPRDSQSFFAAFGVKAFRFASGAEARDRMESLLEAGHAMIAQEYVPGPPANHYFIDGFVDRDGRVRALFARRRLRMYPPEFGNSSFMKSVALEEARSAAEAVSRLLTSLGHRGMFSAEFKRDARDGVFRILEVNARPWWYVDFAARCGVDVCMMAYADALERDVPEVLEYEVDRSLVYPYTDYFACRALRAAGELGAVEWARSWIGADQPVFRASDPWPALAGTAEILSRRLGKAMRRGA